MPLPVQAAIESWTLPVPLTLATVLAAFLYLRGWLHLRSASVNVVPAWRAGSFLLGLFLIWMAVGSPLAAFDEELLTVHMVQHLLLMTLGPALVLMGAPVMPFLHGLPQRFVQGVLGPLFRWAPVQRAGRVLSQPVFCWFAAAAALVGWHIPGAFTLALRSEGWHVAAHTTFLAAGFLFWWPVVQPWPSVSKGPRWWILLYLFLATLPCDILSGFLVFAERVVYPVYLSGGRPFGISATDDQELAGALMWTCITIVYLVPAAILTLRMLGAGNSRADDFVRPELRPVAAHSSGPRSREV